MIPIPGTESKPLFCKASGRRVYGVYMADRTEVQV